MNQQYGLQRPLSHGAILLHDTGCRQNIESEPMPPSAEIERILRLSPVMPVVIIEEAEVAPELARAFVRGGIRVVEITLRTPAALAAVEAIARQVPEIAVGAGTVLSAEDLRSAASAGATFAVSPGATPALLSAAVSSPIPYLPAVATASELMQALAHGHHCLKFFPAGPAGGTAMLKALGGPFPQARFCPTGGITQDSVKSYLDLPNVLCAGGSWLSPADAVAARDWKRIEALASRAAASRT
jgi:2-dehydro-3-deoxyphosphogluconate aldolase/(4S)-4-hydroxy-2-oxoglutarate aldolase